MKTEDMAIKKYIFFAFLILVTFYFYYNNTKILSHSNINYKFSVKDTSCVSKIFLADRNGTSILLEKNKNKWILNKEYDVKKSSINILLSTIKDIRVHKSVPLNSINNSIKDLATNGVKVEIDFKGVTFKTRLSKPVFLDRDELLKFFRGSTKYLRYT